MNIKIIKGNIFTSSCQTVVNTINCSGVMGAGIALEFKLRYPEMFEKYKCFCEQAKIKPGNLWLYKSPSRWILNFPTKNHWKLPTKKEYLELGLEKFLASYESRGITSVAFPVLGAQHGGLAEGESIEIMTKYLEQCDINIEIYKYDARATDDRYENLKNVVDSLDDDKLKELIGLRKDKIECLRYALNQPNINSLSRLTSCEGLGLKTLEKIFAFSDTQEIVIQDEFEFL